MPILQLAGFLAVISHGLVNLARAAGLADIDHIVLFMQENRAFDHYFGTMTGVRGFDDANLQTNDGVPVWRQRTPPELTNETAWLSPWYLNYLGGNWYEATQCMVAGFYKRRDLLTQWTLAENWIVADMYQESVIASTSPNRVTWVSGSINVVGSPQKSDQGGNPYIDNNETPSCENGINCYPLKWKTAAKYYEAAGVSWQVYQDADNFDDNPFAWFKQFQDSKRGSNLHRRGFKGLPLDAFYEQAANGTLPEVSYIVGPAELSEHAPYSPRDGAWLENKLAEAVIRSPKYPKTVLIVSFDETGGWFDHVDPYRSPDGTPGECIDDPYGKVGRNFAGPGFRVPMYIISPWTRRGGVYVDHSDHNSQLLFIEQWQAAKGRNVVTDEMVPCRRQHMSDLTGAFDLESPDYSIPDLPYAPEPHRSKRGGFDGSAHCSILYPRPRLPVPYAGGGFVDDVRSLVESGFKAVRGQLTEGRYLVLAMAGYALSAPSPGTAGDKALLGRRTAKHDAASQRWVAHATGRMREFILSSNMDKRYLCAAGTLCN